MKDKKIKVKLDRYGSMEFTEFYSAGNDYTHAQKVEFLNFCNEFFAEVGRRKKQ